LQDVQELMPEIEAMIQAGKASGKQQSILGSKKDKYVVK